MTPKGNLLQRLQQLDDAAGSRERQAARQRRKNQNSREILQTFLAYRLADAGEKMALGIAIGDPLLLRHEPDNEWDPNAVKVFWKEQWIGYLPKNMAALVTAEVPEVATGLGAVVTGLSTTSQRDAFRLQISIPIEKASRRLRDLGINSAFAWDFDRTSGPDKMRLVVRGTETAFRELQELLGATYVLDKWGYSYYPTQEGRHYPWYLSFTDSSGRAPTDEEPVEQLIRSLFGVPSESTRRRERQERLEELEQKQEEISNRLTLARAEAARARREVENSRRQQEKLAEQSRERKDQAAQEVESLELELSNQEQLLNLAMKENEELDLANQELVTSFEKQQEELESLREIYESDGDEINRLADLTAEGQKDSGSDLTLRLISGLESLSAQLKPRRILELVHELCPDSFIVLDTAWKSADDAAGFEMGDRLFQLLWRLATIYREERLLGKPDIVGMHVFGRRSFAVRESRSVTTNKTDSRARTFTYGGEKIFMRQHLKVGFKHSENRTLRIHFHWDPDAQKVVIGHCGEHLPISS